MQARPGRIFAPRPAAVRDGARGGWFGVGMEWARAVFHGYVEGVVMSKFRPMQTPWTVPDAARWGLSLALALAWSALLAQWLAHPPPQPGTGGQLRLVRLAPPAATAPEGSTQAPGRNSRRRSQPVAAPSLLAPASAAPAREAVPPWEPEGMPPAADAPRLSAPDRQMASVEDEPRGPPRNGTKHPPRGSAAVWAEIPPPPGESAAGARGEAKPEPGPPPQVSGVTGAQPETVESSNGGAGREEVPWSAARKAGNGDRALRRGAGGQATVSAPTPAPAAVLPGRLDPGFRLIRAVLPVYPERARRLRKGGRVRVELSVNPDGRVGEITVSDESGGWGFADSVRAAYRAARFSPPTVGGRAVRVLWRKTLVFKP